jgi:hypothetical protein
MYLCLLLNIQKHKRVIKPHLQKHKHPTQQNHRYDFTSRLGFGFYETPWML